MREVAEKLLLEAMYRVQRLQALVAVGTVEEAVVAGIALVDSCPYLDTAQEQPEIALMESWVDTGTLEEVVADMLGTPLAEVWHTS